MEEKRNGWKLCTYLFFIKKMENETKKNVKSLAIRTGVSMMVSVVCVKVS